MDSQRRRSQAPVRSEGPAVPLVNIRYDPVGCLHHLNRVPAEQLPLVFNQLAPEAAVGPDDGTAGLDPSVGLGQRHAVVLHEVRQAQRGRAAHPGCTVHQHRPSFAPHAVDLVGHAVEVQGDGGVGHVCQGDLHVLHMRPVEVGQLDGGVDHAGDALRQQQAAVGRHVASTEEEVWGDLGDAPQQTPALRQQPWHGGGHHGAAMVVVVMVVVEEALAAGTHRGTGRDSGRDGKALKKAKTSGSQDHSSEGPTRQLLQHTKTLFYYSSRLNIFLFHSRLRP